MGLAPFALVPCYASKHRGSGYQKLTRSPLGLTKHNGRGLRQNQILNFYDNVSTASTNTSVVMPKCAHVSSNPSDGAVLGSVMPTCA